jgi:geranylgeranyl pyrophosphate synthase
MAGGQAMDLAAQGKELSLGELETMHRLKTGALIRASMLMPARASGTDTSLAVKPELLTRTASGSPSRYATTCWTSRATRH